MDQGVGPDLCASGGLVSGGSDNNDNSLAFALPQVTSACALGRVNGHREGGLHLRLPARRELQVLVQVGLSQVMVTLG